MPLIQVLDQNTINQIAAGEVIERPASVVKELLENAIDARATAVTVEIKEGGISLIRITDNGCGIRPDEIALAFLRHSTSKIRSVEDLMTVSSLGFRGEALSSIAAISQVELITKIPDALNGSRYVIEGGEERLLEEIGCPEGTTFLVRNLFYNVPARRKFLRTAQTEAGYVAEIVERIALAHPEVSIRFIHNNQNKLHTSGNSKQRDVIYQIYGREISANLLEVRQEANFGVLSGFVGKPLIARGNRSFENYYVNGRYIKSQIIAKAIEEAYQPYLMQHKYPFVVLNLQIRSELLDVNVHPTKMELRFRNGQEVFSFIRDAVAGALGHRELIPEVELAEREPEQKEHTAKSHYRAPEPFEKRRSETVREPLGYLPVPAEPSEERRQNAGGNQIEEQVKTAERQVKTEPEKKPEQLELFAERLLSEEARPGHRLIGQLFDTYWLVQYQDKLFLIDQHAAHEKVLYERTMKGLENREYSSQLLNPPMIITMDLRQEELFLQNRKSFEEIGFAIEPFGGREYAVSAVPDNLFGLMSREVFQQMLDSLSEEWKPGTQRIVMEKIASMSCKAAVKGNHAFSTEEADSLIDQLLKLDNPYHCPHGRPTVIAMTKAELERKFKRIV